MVQQLMRMVSFSLDVKKMPTTISVSSLGFKTVEKSIVDASYVTIVLEDNNLALDEVVLVGSRNKNRTVSNTPVPVDVIDVTELVSSGPQVSVNDILNYVAPSFTSTSQTVSDGTDHINPAALRGLGSRSSIGFGKWKKKTQYFTSKCK